MRRPYVFLAVLLTAALALTLMTTYVAANPPENPELEPEPDATLYSVVLFTGTPNSTVYTLEYLNMTVWDDHGGVVWVYAIGAVPVAILPNVYFTYNGSTYRFSEYWITPNHEIPSTYLGPLVGTTAGLWGVLGIGIIVYRRKL